MPQCPIAGDANDQKTIVLFLVLEFLLQLSRRSHHIGHYLDQCTDKRPPDKRPLRQKTTKLVFLWRNLKSPNYLFFYSRAGEKMTKITLFVAVVYSKFLLNLQTSRKFRPIYLFILNTQVHYSLNFFNVNYKISTMVVFCPGGLLSEWPFVPWSFVHTPSWTDRQPQTTL